MDEARGTFEKDMETLESMLPFSFSSLSLSLSLSLSISYWNTSCSELEQERRSHTEAEHIFKRLEAENDKLNIKLYAEIKSRQRTEKAKKTLDEAQGNLDNQIKQRISREGKISFAFPPSLSLGSIFRRYILIVSFLF